MTVEGTDLPLLANEIEVIGAAPGPAAGGEAIFARSCAACHQPQGQGIPNIFPLLARSGFLANLKEAAIEFVLFGHVGQIVVNGKTYNNVMPPQPLADEEVANVLT